MNLWNRFKRLFFRKPVDPDKTYLIVNVPGATITVSGVRCIHTVKILAGKVTFKEEESKPRLILDGHPKTIAPVAFSKEAITYAEAIAYHYGARSPNP